MAPVGRARVQSCRKGEIVHKGRLLVWNIEVKDNKKLTLYVD